MAQNKSQGSGSGTSNRGFASMDEQKQREIASKGGRSVAAQDRSFSQNRELAAQAGRKGGQASHGGRGAQRRGAASVNGNSPHPGGQSETASRRARVGGAATTHSNSNSNSDSASRSGSSSGSGSGSGSDSGSGTGQESDSDEIQGIE